MKKIKIRIIIYLYVLLFHWPLLFAEQNDITGILGALDIEIKLLKGKINNLSEETIEGIKFFKGKIEERQVVLIKTGIGKVNAAMITTLLIEHFKPNEIIFSGIAGGINPKLYPGDVVIASETGYHDYGILKPNGMEYHMTRNPMNNKRNPLFFPADPGLLKIAKVIMKKISLEKIKIKNLNRNPKIQKGIIISGDIFISSSSKKTELYKNLKADAVEMEGAAVAQICWQQEVPFLLIRSISDKADEKALHDIKKFKKIAARNSAKIILEIIKQLRLEDK